MGYLPSLISLISKPRAEYHEHLLSLLVAIIEENSEAIAECQKSQYKLKELIQRYMSSIRNKEECQVKNKCSTKHMSYKAVIICRHSHVISNVF